MKIDSKKLTIVALFISITIILTRFISIDTPFLRVSIGAVPIYLGSLLLGPIYGLIIGAVSDLLGYVIKTTGVYFIGFTINASIKGLIPGLFIKYYDKNRSWFRIFLIILPIEIITSLILTPLWLSILMKKAYILSFINPEQLIRLFMIPIYAFLTNYLYKILDKSVVFK